jgi:hypothetical protein
MTISKNQNNDSTICRRYINEDVEKRHLSNKISVGRRYINKDVEKKRCRQALYK